MNSMLRQRPDLSRSAQAAGLSNDAHLVVLPSQAAMLFRDPKFKLITSVAKLCLNEVAHHISPRYGTLVVNSIFLVLGGLQLHVESKQPDTDPNKLFFTAAGLGLDTLALANGYAHHAIVPEDSLKNFGYVLRLASNSQNNNTSSWLPGLVGTPIDPNGWAKLVGHSTIAGSFTLPAEVDGDTREILEPLLELGAAALDPQPDKSALSAIPLRAITNPNTVPPMNA
jgi:hypothetical protein